MALAASIWRLRRSSRWSRTSPRSFLMVSSWQWSSRAVALMKAALAADRIRSIESRCSMSRRAAWMLTRKVSDDMFLSSPRIL